MLLPLGLVVVRIGELSFRLGCRLERSALRFPVLNLAEGSRAVLSYY